MEPRFTPLDRAGASLLADAPRSLASRGACGALAAKFHDALTPRASESEIVWYREHLPSDAGTLLAAMCSSGRLLLPLLQAGLSLHGVDTSEAMLSSCAERCRIAGFDAQLFRQDVVTLNLPFRYGAAFVAAGTFQLLERSAAHDALSSLRAHLIEPAVLLLDLFVPESALHPPGAPVVEVGRAVLADGSLVVRRSETLTDPERRQVLISSRYEQRVAGRIVAREDEAQALTWYNEQEMLAMLRANGYRNIRIEAAACPDLPGQRFAVSSRG